MKQKLWKKIFSILLVLCMILSVMPANPVTVKAAGGSADTITLSKIDTGSTEQPMYEDYGKKFAAGTSEGNEEVGAGTADGWYWDGQNNFYMTNCTLTLEGNTTSCNTGYILLYFGITDTLNIHLKGENKMILQNTNMGMNNYMFVTAGMDDGYDIQQYNIVGNNKSTDSLAVEIGQGVTFEQASNNMISFNFQNLRNCRLICNNPNLSTLFHIDGAMESANGVFNLCSNQSSAMVDFPNQVTGGSSLQVYNNPGSVNSKIHNKVVVRSDTDAGAYVINNGVMVNSDKTIGTSASGKTVSWALENRPNKNLSWVDLTAQDVSKPLIIKPAGPNYYDLTCKAGSGVASMAVSYTHEDVGSGAKQTPALSEGNVPSRKGQR